jgi:tetratricopeptide (TPR) repeat protein
MAVMNTGDLFTFGERVAATSRDTRSRMARRVREVAWPAALALRPLVAVATVAFVLLVASGLVMAVMHMSVPDQTQVKQNMQTWHDDLLLLLQVLLLLLAAGVLVALVCWLVHAEAGVVGPFADATGGRLTAVPDLLVGHLDRIAAVHRAPIADIPAERLRTQPVSANPEPVDSSLANVGTINVGGQVTISIGQLLISLKRLMPGGRGTQITGSVQRYGGRTQIVASVRRSGRTDTIMVEAWSRSPRRPDDVVPTMVRELAFRIHFALANDRMQAGRWELLEAFTEARAAYARYLGSRQPAHCHRALRLTLHAHGLDGTYERLFGLFYALGTSYFGMGDYERAIQQLDTALTINPRHPQALIQKARCRYAMEEDREALRLLKQADRKPPDGHPMARYLRGMIVGASGDHRTAICALKSVDRRPRSLRSSAQVTIAGLHSQASRMAECRAALDKVAEADFGGDHYSRACWLAVRSTLPEHKRDCEKAVDELRLALEMHLVPPDYARRDPDLRSIVGMLPELRSTSRAAARQPLGLVAGQR